MDRQLDSIVELQHALNDKATADAQLTDIPDWMKELHEEHSAAKQEIDDLAAESDAALSERRAAEAGVADYQEKLKTFQEQIARVRNQREYGALLQEIDGAKNEIKTLEEQGLEALERQEQAQRGIEERQEAFGEIDARYSTELEKWEAQKPDIVERMKGLDERIQALRESLQDGVLGQFDRILERYSGQALAQVMRMQRVSKKSPQIWHCGSCNYRVRPQAVVEIVNQGAIVLCDSCKRILYIEEEEA